MSSDEALRLLLSDDFELRRERIHEAEFVIEETGSGLGR